MWDVFEVDRRLDADGPRPREDFVQALAHRVERSAAPPQRKRSVRFVAAGALTAGAIAAGGSFGGLSNAADRLAESSTAVAHVVSSEPPPPGRSLALTAATVEYIPFTSLSAPGPRAGYCSVEGNSTDAGVSIPPGVFLNLELGQPDLDPHFKGAEPAFYIEGIGLTCDAPSQAFSLSDVGPVDDTGQPNPPGIKLPGNIYPYFTKPAP